MPDPYLTADEVQALVPRLATEADATINLHVARFEERAERYIGQAFRARSFTHVGTPVDGWLDLPHYEVSAIASVVDESANAVTYTRLHSRLGQLEGIWSSTPLTVTGTHGATTPTELMKEACVEYVSRKVALTASGTSRDIKFSGDGGSTVYERPDWKNGKPTGFTEVDDALNAERNRRVMVF